MAFSAEIFALPLPFHEAPRAPRPAMLYNYSGIAPTPPTPPTPTPPTPPPPPTPPAPATSLQLAISRLPQYLRI